MDAKPIFFGRKTTAAAKRRDDREEIHNAASYGGTIGHLGQQDFEMVVRKNQV
jgi:hypothetical protein